MASEVDEQTDMTGKLKIRSLKAKGEKKKVKEQTSQLCRISDLTVCE